MKRIKLITLSIVCVFIGHAQQTPADKQSNPIAILGGTAHLGNGTVIQNSFIAFENGILQTISCIECNMTNISTHYFHKKQSFM